MKAYLDIKTNMGVYAVEVSTEGYGAANYTIWNESGTSVTDGVYLLPFDSLREVAEQVVEEFVSETI